MAGQTSTDPNVFILPDLGEGVHEAELISWKVSPGETVEEHQVVAEMETDKALVEVPSPRDGVIKELRGNPGDILNVGEIAWTYEGASETATPAPAPTPAPAAAAPKEEREDDGTVVGTMSGEISAVTSREGKALATPAVRRIARDLSIDIDTVSGTGLAGRVTEKDVRAASNGAPASVAPPLLPPRLCRHPRNVSRRLCPRKPFPQPLRRACSSRPAATRRSSPSAACVARSPTASASRSTQRSTSR